MKLVQVMVRAVQAFTVNDGTAMAGYIAFSTLLGLFPFLILAANLGATLVGPAQSEALIDALFEYAPEHVARTLEPVVDDVLQGSDKGLMTISALAALWFSSNAVEAIRTAFERAYQVAAPHGLVTGRLISVLAVLVGVSVALFLGVTVVFGPLLMRTAEHYAGISIPGIAEPLRLAAGLVVFALYLALLHRVLPRLAGDRPLWPGVFVSTIIWILAAMAFSAYLGTTSTYASTYGALAGVVITLMFFYITGLAVIFGAEINAALARMKKVG